MKLKFESKQSNAPISMTRRVALLVAAMAFTASSLFTPSAFAQGSPAVSRVKFVTSEGDFVMEVYPDKAPKTVENFLQYVRDKHYDGTVFHRVISNFMVQGGGYDSAYAEKKTRPPGNGPPAPVGVSFILLITSMPLTILPKTV